MYTGTQRSPVVHKTRELAHHWQPASGTLSPAAKDQPARLDEGRSALPRYIFL
jgi:hypothetical protein